MRCVPSIFLFASHLTGLYSALLTRGSSLRTTIYYERPVRAKRILAFSAPIRNTHSFAPVLTTHPQGPLIMHICACRLPSCVPLMSPLRSLSSLLPIHSSHSQLFFCTRPIHPFPCSSVVPFHTWFESTSDAGDRSNSARPRPKANG